MQNSYSISTFSIECYTFNDKFILNMDIHFSWNILLIFYSSDDNVSGIALVASAYEGGDV